MNTYSTVLLDYNLKLKFKFNKNLKIYKLHQTQCIFFIRNQKKNTSHNTIPGYNNTVIVCNNNDYSTVITTVGNYIKKKKRYKQT